jgi:hypothetical protein
MKMCWAFAGMSNIVSGHVEEVSLYLKHIAAYKSSRELETSLAEKSGKI